MDAEVVRAMLREDRAAWEALGGGLEARRQQTPYGPAAPPWTSRDVYAHLARWINHSVDHLEAALAGRTFPPVPGSDDEINARWQAEDSHLTLDEARARADAAFERRIRAITAVPAERWNGELEQIARADGAEHYEDHRRFG